MTTETTTTYATAADYAAATVAAKARMRADATAAMHAAIDALDLTGAAAARDAMKAWVAAPSAVATIDYALTVAQRVANLRAAADLLESGSVRPSGIAADCARFIGPVAPDAAAAAAIASAKVTRSAKRNDIEAAIEAAFADLPSGSFLSCTQIANKQGLPSSGAVAARHNDWESDTVVAVAAVPGVSPKGYAAV